jgi:hypothetical protein
MRLARKYWQNQKTFAANLTQFDFQASKHDGTRRHQQISSYGSDRTLGLCWLVVQTLYR